MHHVLGSQHLLHTSIALSYHHERATDVEIMNDLLYIMDTLCVNLVACPSAFLSGTSATLLLGSAESDMLTTCKLESSLTDDPANYKALPVWLGYKPTHVSLSSLSDSLLYNYPVQPVGCSALHLLSLIPYSFQIWSF